MIREPGDLPVVIADTVDDGKVRGMFHAADF